MDKGNPRNAGALLLLAEVQHEQNHLASADSLYREATRVRELTVPASHPEAAWIRLRHGALLLEQGEVEAARAMIEPAAKALAKALPPNHWRVTYARALAAACRLDKQDPAAHAKFESQLARVVAELGPDDRLVKELEQIWE